MTVQHFSDVQAASVLHFERQYGTFGTYGTRLGHFEQPSGSRLIGLPCPLAPKTFPNVFHTMHPGSIQEHPGSPAGRPWQLEDRMDTLQRAAQAGGSAQAGTSWAVLTFHQDVLN